MCVTSVHMGGLFPETVRFMRQEKRRKGSRKGGCQMGDGVLCGGVSQTVSAEEELRKIQLSEMDTEKP